MGFFDKLKGGVKEEHAPTPPKEKISKKPSQSKTLGRVRQTVKLSAGKKLPPEPVETEKTEILQVEDKKKEPDFEGELAIDVYETDSDFYVQSTIAGVKPEDLDITIENDMVTIRGNRQKQAVENTKKYYYQECYWGSFSRQVILPEEVDGTNTEASMKDGVLTLRIPKIIKIKKHKIKVA